MFDNDTSDNGQKLPGIPGSYGHEQRPTQRRARTVSSSRETQKASRQATRVRTEADAAAGRTSRLPESGGPTFTGSGGDGPLGQVDLRKQTQMIMRRIKWTLRAGAIVLIGLVALGLAVGEEDDTDPSGDLGKISERIAVNRPATSADAKAYFSGPRFQAALDTAVREVSADDATVTQMQCYVANCSVTLQHGDETTHVSIDSELKTRTRDRGMPTDPGTKPSDAWGAVLTRVLEATERKFDVSRKDLTNVKYSPDDRYGQRTGWTAAYYVDGERSEFGADADGTAVRRLPSRE